MNIVAIDIGTNTCRLLVIDTKKNKKILKKRIVTRLGENFNGKLTDSAQQRVLLALDDFQKLMNKANVKKYRAVATSVVREAKNKKEFLERVKKYTNIIIDVIDGQEEAELTYKGVVSVLDKRVKNFLLLDIGGGSNEYSLVKNKIVCDTISLNFGVVFLYDKYIKHDPPLLTELKDVESEILRNLSLIKKKFNNIPKNFVGTAGTITSISAINLNLKEYDERKINNNRIEKSFIDSLYFKFLRMTNKERLKKFLIEKGREDVIIPGILIVKKTMEFFNFSKIISIDAGLLEGIIFSIL